MYAPNERVHINRPRRKLLASGEGQQLVHDASAAPDGPVGRVQHPPELSVRGQPPGEFDIRVHGRQHASEVLGSSGRHLGNRLHPVRADGLLVRDALVGHIPTDGVDARLLDGGRRMPGNHALDAIGSHHPGLQRRVKVCPFNQALERCSRALDVVGVQEALEHSTDRLLRRNARDSLDGRACCDDESCRVQTDDDVVRDSEEPLQLSA